MNSFLCCVCDYGAHYGVKKGRKRLSSYEEIVCFANHFWKCWRFFGITEANMRLKYGKTVFQTNISNTQNVQGCWDLRPPKGSTRGPRKSREPQDSFQEPSKGNHKKDICFTSVCTQRLLLNDLRNGTQIKPKMR